jgi:hypothetical protein
MRCARPCSGGVDRRRRAENRRIDHRADCDGDGRHLLLCRADVRGIERFKLVLVPQRAVTRRTGELGLRGCHGASGARAGAQRCPTRMVSRCRWRARSIAGQSTVELPAWVEARDDLHHAPRPATQAGTPANFGETPITNLRPPGSEVGGGTCASPAPTVLEGGGNLTISLRAWRLRGQHRDWTVYRQEVRPRHSVVWRRVTGALTARASEALGWRRLGLE